MALQESGEMYLETILILSQKKEKVHAVDISEYMGYSKPSVSRAVGLLLNGDYIQIQQNGSITLTPGGREVAETMYERHQTISQYLISIGVPEKIAMDDACKIEHVISPESFEALKKNMINPTEKNG